MTEGQRASKPKENPKPNDKVVAEIREIKSDLAMLKQQNNSNFVAPSSWPRGRSLNRGRGRGLLAPRDPLLECIGDAQIVSLLDSPILADTVLNVGHLTTTRAIVTKSVKRDIGQNTRFSAVQLNDFLVPTLLTDIYNRFEFGTLQDTFDF